MSLYRVERWLCRYNTHNRYPCPLKGCSKKLRNGRCGLDMSRLELDENNERTGRCYDFKEMDKNELR